VSDNQFNLEEIDRLIQSMKKAAETAAEQAESFPALKKNVDRILASIKMLEINISDIITLDDE
tara:strand:+ start:2560 stop:2748 length:189 start_codon:yes stop_codon:yes gene_type:complete